MAQPGFHPQTYNLVPYAGATNAVATGGTAVTVATGPINGGYVVNPVDAAGQGIATAENLYIDMVAAPGSTAGSANGTNTALVPGQVFTLPAVGPGVLVQANAATNGHKLTVVLW